MPLGVTNFPAALDVHQNDSTATPETFSEAPRLFVTALSNSITNTDTTLTIPSTAVLPTKGVMIIESEPVLWTAKPSGTTLTIVRGAFGVTAVSHNSGAPAACVPTAGQFNAHSAAIAAIQKKLGFKTGGANQVAATNKILGGDASGQTSWRNAFLADVVASEFLTKIAEIVVSGSSVAALSFSSIPQTFRHLILLGGTRSTDAAVAVGTNVVLNSDSGANYDREYLFGNNVTITAGEQFAGTSIQLSGTPGAGAAASRFGTKFIILPYYRDTAHRKNGIEFSGLIYDVTAGTFYSIIENINWRNTAAITSIVFTLSAGNFDVGTIMALYGLP